MDSSCFSDTSPHREVTASVGGGGCDGCGPFQKMAEQKLLLQLLFLNVWKLGRPPLPNSVIACDEVVAVAAARACCRRVELRRKEEETLQ